MKTRIVSKNRNTIETRNFEYKEIKTQTCSFFTIKIFYIQFLHSFLLIMLSLQIKYCEFIIIKSAVVINIHQILLILILYNFYTQSRRSISLRMQNTPLLHQSGSSFKSGKSTQSGTSNLSSAQSNNFNQSMYQTTYHGIISSFDIFMQNSCQFILQKVQKTNQFLSQISYLYEKLLKILQNKENIPKNLYINLVNIKDNIKLMQQRGSSVVIEALRQKLKKQEEESQKMQKYNQKCQRDYYFTSNLQLISVLIEKIICKLFKGQHKQFFTNIVLGLQQEFQRIFMQIITKQKQRQTFCCNKLRLGIQSGSRQRYSKNTDKQTSSTKVLDQCQPKCIQKQKLGDIQTATIYSQYYSNSNNNQQMYSDKLTHTDNGYSYKTNFQSNSSLTQLINKILTLQEGNQAILQQFQIINSENHLLKLQADENKKIVETLQDQNKKLHANVCDLLNKQQILQHQAEEQKIKIQKHFRAKISIIQKSKQDQIKQLKQIYDLSRRSNEQKIQSYEKKLERKRQKIRKLQENKQMMEHSFKKLQDDKKLYVEQIKELNQKIRQNRAYIYELELIKDNLSLELDLRNSRLQDMRLMLAHEMQRKKIIRQKANKHHQHSNNVDQSNQCLQITNNQNQLSWYTNSNQWRSSSHASHFMKLNLKSNNNSYGTSGFGESSSNWKNQNIRHKASQIAHIEEQQMNLNGYYQKHINYLKHMIQNLQIEKLQNSQELKSLKDLRFQNKKLIQSLKQHQSYRGQQNQIILGCIYQMAKQFGKKQKKVTWKIVDQLQKSGNFNQRFAQALNQINIKEIIQQQQNSCICHINQISYHHYQDKCEDLSYYLQQVSDNNGLNLTDFNAILKE